MRGRLVRWGLAAGAALLLAGAAVAASQGDSLISLSYLTKTFIPSLVAQGDGVYQEKMEQTYNDAINQMELPAGAVSGTLGSYSADMRQREFGRGDVIDLETGSSFLMLSGQAALTHSGAVIDVTAGQAVASGAALETGHRYLVGENTAAQITVRSGYAAGGIEGSYKRTASREEAAPFTDVTSSDWYSPAVDYAYFNGLFDGMGDGTFAPQGEMNRAMMMTVLFHLAGSPENERLGAKATFTDVPAAQWYSTFISWAADYGVSAGVGNGQFAPNQAVPRQQVVVLLYNFATNYMGMTLRERVDISSCSDYGQSAEWARDALSWASACGVISAGTSGALEPNRSATRAEVASMLMNFSQLYLG